MAQSLESVLPGLRKEFRQIRDQQTTDMRRRFAGETAGWDNDAAMAMRLCKSRDVAWSSLVRAVSGDSDQRDANWAAQMEGPGATHRRPHVGFSDTQWIERLHYLQTALANSWALYEFVWVRLVGPLSMVAGKPGVTSEPAPFQKHLTTNPDPNQWSSSGWPRKFLWNNAASEIEFLWSLRCALMHDPAALISSGCLEAAVGCAWQIDLDKLRKVLDQRGGKTATLKDDLRGIATSGSAVGYLVNADAKLDRTLARLLEQTHRDAIGWLLL